MSFHVSGPTMNDISASPLRPPVFRSVTSVSQEQIHIHRPSPQTTPRPQRTRSLIPIRFISVVHYGKEGGKCYYACRVIGDSDNQAYTVSKTWDQFLDLSTQLCERYPSKHLPRLNKKMTLFVTRSTLVGRREELDLWVKCLIDIAEVRKSRLLHDFFAPPNSSESAARSPTFDETIRATRTHSPRPSLGSARMHAPLQITTSDPFAKSPVHATFQNGLPVPAMRQFLNHKRSTPNLRLHEELEIDIPETPLPMSPLPPRREASDDSQSVAIGTWLVRPQSPPSRPTSPEAPSSLPYICNEPVIRNRPSLDSVARSVSTDHTITPANCLGNSITSIVMQDTDEAAVSPPLPPKSVAQLSRPKGLRHFMSLQDIRQHVLPHPTVPPPPSAPLDAFPQPPSSAARPNMPRSRSSSGASEIQPFAFTSTSMLRERSDSAILPARQRRPSARSQSSVRSLHRQHQSTKSSGSHHSHSNSSSSLLSLERGDWIGSNRDSVSLSSESGPGSPMSFAPLTPPTPQWPDGLHQNKPVLDQELVNAIFNGNLVPLPATFARNAASVRSRSRSGSLAHHAARSNLDPILGSPTFSTAEEHITLKVRHEAANVVLKVDRLATLAEVKAKITEKLRNNGIQVKPMFDIWLCPRQQATTGETESLPFSGEGAALNELSWDVAASNATKVVLLC